MISINAQSTTSYISGSGANIFDAQRAVMNAVITSNQKVVNQTIYYNRDGSVIVIMQVKSKLIK